ncbi:hypothetical protein D3C81_1922690 [compost metagenome]
MRSNAVLSTHAVAHGLTGLFVQQLGQTLRHVAGRQTTRLQQNNPPLNAIVRKKLQRQPGRFPGAGRCGQQNLR